MATTLSKGYKKPTTGERGSSFFLALEDNIELSNSHAHTGVDGEPIAAKHLAKVTDTIASAAWSAVAGQSGTYRQLVSVPEDYIFDTAEMKFFVSGGPENGHQLFPSVERVTDTSYYVYINDPITLKVTYG